MLQTIREHTQGWIAGVIIGIIILSFALWGIHSYLVTDPNTHLIAQVNGVEITKEQINVAYDRLRRELQMQYGATRSLTSADEQSLKAEALHSVIDLEALKQAAFKHHFRISERQINTYLQTMPAFQIDGRFSDERFQEVLGANSLSVSEFVDLVRTNLVIEQPKLGMMLSAFALPDEVAYTAALVNQRREIEYINIPLPYFLAQPVPISPQQINEYYQQHKSGFMTPAQVNLEYIELSLKSLAATIHPTETMLNNFYNENINSYSQPRRWQLKVIDLPKAPDKTWQQVQQQAASLMTALKQNKNISQLLHTYHATLNQQNWQSLTDLPDAWQKVVGDLTSPRAVAPPLKTEKGMTLIQVEAITEPHIEPFTLVKEKVKQAYMQQRAEEKMAELRERLADITYEHPDSLQPAAQELNLPIKTSGWFTQDKPGKDIAQYKKVRDAAFSNDVLNLQNNSDLIQVNPETVLVLRVKAHIPAALLPLAGIAKLIENKLKTQGAEQRAQHFAEQLHTQLQQGADPNTIARTHKLIWNKPGFIGRYSTKVDSAILDLAFRLPAPTTTPNKVSYGVARLPNGFALIALRHIQEGQINDKKEYAVFAEQQQNNNALLEYELYKQSQIAHSRIKILQPSGLKN